MKEKCLVLSIVQTHSEPWSVDCILMLKRECKVVMSSMSTLQTCITLAIEDPSHLRRGIPAEDAEEEERVVEDEEAEAEEKRVKADHGLTMLKRVPDHLSGMELFEHQVRFRQRHYGKDGNIISAHLMVSPRGKFQNNMLAPDFASSVQHHIMRDIGTGGTERLSQRKLDCLGYIKSHSCFVNDPKRMDRLRSRLELARSLEDVKEFDDEDAKQTKRNKEGELLKVLPQAIQMFLDGIATKTFAKKFTKNLISSILLICFNLRVSGKKAPMLKALEDAYENNPDKLVSPAPAPVEI